MQAPSVLILIAALTGHEAIHAMPAKPAQFPIVKIQPAGTERPRENAKGVKAAPKQDPLVVEALVSGNLKTVPAAQSEVDRLLDPISIFTALLVLVGLGQIWFLRNADKAMTRTAEAAKTSADVVISQLRAYISLVPQMTPDLSKPVPPEFTVVFKNVGQTPAYDFVHWVNMGILPYPLIEEPPGPLTSDRTRVTIPPQGEIVSAHRDNPILDDAAINDIKDGSKYRLYAWGRADYKDAFGKVRYFRFRLMIGGPDREPGAMTLCPEGNDSN